MTDFVDAGHRQISSQRLNRKKKESYDYNFDYDTANQQSQGHEENYDAEVTSLGKSGYSDGSGIPLDLKNIIVENSLDDIISGLRSIAQGSADQANSAVVNQHLAAKQASYIAQNNLANLALQASATAMAALQGKQVLLAKIERENLDAHQALENELTQLRQAKRSAKAAQQVKFILNKYAYIFDLIEPKSSFQAAQQATNHLSVLQAALK